MIEVVQASRYVTPLREGGSLPGLVEADDLGIYVVKFRGAGQGVKALVSEVIVGELGRRLGVAVPDLRGIQLDAAIARYEADEEVQDLLNASIGLNLGVDFLPGAFGYDAGTVPDPEVASRIVWLDAFTANVDRSWRNPNLLLWHGRLWAIDHGAALYFHHGWTSGIGDPERFAEQPYDLSNHVLARYAAGAVRLHDELASTVTGDLLDDVLDEIPDLWLDPAPGAASPDEVRAVYRDFLEARLASASRWLPRAAAA